MTWSILLVDDSTAARTSLRMALEAKGATVVEAQNGREGLFRAKTQPIDLIVTDVHMPVMDGLQMIQELRKESEYSAVPILVLTSDVAGSRAAEGRAAGATSWLVKPVTPELVWKAIEKVLFGKQPRAASNDAPARGVSPR